MWTYSLFPDRPFGTMTRQYYNGFQNIAGTADVDLHYGFTGRETFTGRADLWNYRSRYLDSAQGRFLQHDSYRGNESAPPSLHRYIYTLNSPVTYVDPFGRSAVIDDAIADILAVELWAFVLNLFVFALTAPMIYGEDSSQADFAHAFWSMLGSIGGVLFYIMKFGAHFIHSVAWLHAAASTLVVVGAFIDLGLLFMHALKVWESPRISSDQKTSLTGVVSALTILGIIIVGVSFAAPEISLALGAFYVIATWLTDDMYVEPLAKYAEAE